MDYGVLFCQESIFRLFSSKLDLLKAFKLQKGETAFSLPRFKRKTESRRERERRCDREKTRYSSQLKILEHYKGKIHIEFLPSTANVNCATGNAPRGAFLVFTAILPYLKSLF